MPLRAGLADRPVRHSDYMTTPPPDHPWAEFQPSYARFRPAALLHHDVDVQGFHGSSSADQSAHFHTKE
jgi:hypothetical protein